MDDRTIAGQIAADLEKHLHEFAGELGDDSVYGLALWANDQDGSIGISIGTERAYAGQISVPAYVNAPDKWRGVNGLRWGSGNWPQVVRPFLSAETTAALRPFSEVIYDIDRAEEERCVTLRRFFEIAYSAVLQTSIPTDLRTSHDLLMWAEHGDEAAYDHAQIMLRTVDPQRFHMTFPEYRQLASAIDGLYNDPPRLRRLREDAVRAQERGFGSTPPSPQLPPEVHVGLEVCGTWWYMVASEDGVAEEIRKIAATTTRPGAWPCPHQPQHPDVPAL